MDIRFESCRFKILSSSCHLLQEHFLVLQFLFPEKYTEQNFYETPQKLDALQPRIQGFPLTHIKKGKSLDTRLYTSFKAKEISELFRNSRAGAFSVMSSFSFGAVIP